MKSCNVRLYVERRKKLKRRKAKIFLLSLLLLVPLVVSYVFLVVNPIVVEATRASVFSLSTSAVSDAVCDVLGDENLTYKDIVNVEKDESGAVSLISLDTVKLNLIARRFYQVAQVYLDEMGQCGVMVSLGTFTGLPFLSGVGPDINLKLTPIGAMTSTFESRFVSAGINQTNHSIFVRLYASVSLILPSYSQTIDSVTEVLVAENIIVGKIPQVYFSSSSPLNFSPSN